MSDDEGVTPFQEVPDASLMAATPAWGEGALGTWRSQGGSRTPSREKLTLEAGTSLWANQRRRGVRVPALEHRYEWEGSRRKCQGQNRDWGNPTVRDRRGACGIVCIMGAGLRPVGKPTDTPPYPTMLRAPHFYPDHLRASAPRSRAHVYQHSAQDCGGQRGGLYEGEECDHDRAEVHGASSELHRGGILGAGVLRVHGGIGRRNGSSEHPATRKRGRALRPDEARSISRLQAAHGVRAPLRRSPNKPPALPGVI